MEQYISKSALALEIEKKAKYEETWMEKQGYTAYHQGLRDAYKCILSLINTFEAKEIDLEKEIDRYYNIEAPKEFEDVLYEDIEKFAKHFFELGILKQTMKDD